MSPANFEVDIVVTTTHSSTFSKQFLNGMSSHHKPRSVIHVLKDDYK